jgi:hypothetical protein
VNPLLQSSRQKKKKKKKKKKTRGKKKPKTKRGTIETRQPYHIVERKSTGREPATRNPFQPNLAFSVYTILSPPSITTSTNSSSSFLSDAPRRQDSFELEKFQTLFTKKFARFWERGKNFSSRLQEKFWKSSISS